MGHVPIAQPCNGSAHAICVFHANGDQKHAQNNRHEKARGLQERKVTQVAAPKSERMTWAQGNEDSRSLFQAITNNLPTCPLRA
eukprot:4622938-Pyramimonas_sp.AAC.1